MTCARCEGRIHGDRVKDDGRLWHLACHQNALALGAVRALLAAGNLATAEVLEAIEPWRANSE